MSNPMIRVRLIAGDDELDIHDWKDYVLMGNGLTDSGSSVELRWQVPLEPCKGGTGNLQRLVGELRKYIQRAKLYEQENIGDPVYLAVYWPECEDIPVPSFGRGWRYKRIVDGALAEATPGMGQGQPDFRFGSDAIPVLAAMFAVKQDPDGEYAWRSEFRWVAQATGHLEPVAENGIKLWEESQNIITNGDFELGKAGWTDTGLTSTVSAERAKFGVRSLLITPAVGTCRTPFTDPAPPSHFIATAWFYLPCGVDHTQIGLTLDDDVNPLVTQLCADVHDEWQRVQVDYDTNAGSAAWFVYIACNEVNASRYFWVDGVQVEMRLEVDGPTPFIEPDRHLGEVWDTCYSPHTSMSTRNEGECRVVRPIERNYATPCCGSFHCWYRPGYDNALVSGVGQATIFDWLKDSNNFIWVYFDYSTNTFELKVNNFVQVTTVDAFMEGDYIGVGATWDFINDEYKLYLRGVPGVMGTTVKICPDLRGEDIFWGSEFDHDNQANGDLYDCRMWTEILTDVQMKAVHEEGRGNGELPYVWGEKGSADHPTFATPMGVELENHDDCTDGDTNWVEFGNIAGDISAVSWVMVKAESSIDGIDPTEMQLWYGLRRHAASIQRIYNRGQFVWEGEDYHTTINWITTLATDAANTSNGEHQQTSTMGTSWAAASSLAWHLAKYNYDITWLRGQWRVCARIRTDHSADVYFRMYTTGEWNHFQTPYIPSAGGLQCQQNSALGSGALWEWHDFGVIDIPVTYMAERQANGRSMAPLNFEMEQVELILEVMGASASDKAECDYIMLIPESMGGIWGDISNRYTTWPGYHVSDTESQAATCNVQMEDVLSAIIPPFGVEMSPAEPYPHRGDPLWIPPNIPSRCVFAFTEYSDGGFQCLYEHVINRALYVKTMMGHRYRTSR